MSDASGHTAAVAEPLRDKREVFRVDAREKQMIADLAAIHGLPPGTYARRAALGQLGPVGSQSPAPRSHAVEVDDVQADPAAETLAEAFPAVVRLGGQVPPRVAAKIYEAKHEDEVAMKMFVDRRTRELYGQGKTTVLARAEAEAEWRNR